MKFIRAVLLFAFPLYLASCGTQKRIPNYIENISDSSGKGDVMVQELRIQKNDILYIQVYSAATRPEVDAPFNLPVLTSNGNTVQQGFLVDAKGNIEYPRLGTFHAEGLTKDSLAALIRQRLTEPEQLLVDPTVIIRFANFKVAVLGEVMNQGVMTIPSERVTILEAIGLAGGINEWGLKDAVKVIREVDGKREIGQVNLASDSLFLSPYYNLMQNDVVLIQPTKKKAKKAEQDVVLQRVSLGLSVVTAIALLYNVFSR